MEDNSHNQDPDGLEALARRDAPVWIWDAAAGRILWSNGAGVAAWGAASPEALMRERADRAMPALVQLRQLQRAGDQATGVSERRLVFWTARGAQTLMCRCRTMRHRDTEAAVLVEVAGAEPDHARAPASAQPGGMPVEDHAPPSGAHRRNENGSQSTEAGDADPMSAVTMAEIARQIEAAARLEQGRNGAADTGNGNTGTVDTGPADTGAGGAGAVPPAIGGTRPGIPALVHGAAARSNGSSDRPTGSPVRSDCHGRGMAGGDDRAVCRATALALADLATLPIAIFEGSRLLAANARWNDTLHGVRQISPRAPDGSGTVELGDVFPALRVAAIAEKAHRRDRLLARRTKARTATGELRDVTIAVKTLCGGGGADVLYAVAVDGIDVTAELSWGMRMMSGQRDDTRAREGETATLPGGSFALFAQVGHEVRTPLNSIIGFAEMMREAQFGPLGNVRYVGYVEDILTSAHHALSLVNDFLDLARLRAGKSDIEHGRVDAVAVAREAVSAMRPLALRRSIALMLDLPGDSRFVIADARALKQVLLNLLANAIKFSGEGTGVTVGCAMRSDSALVLSVADEGPGMTAAETREALEPFRRLAPAAGGDDGTGLGLPLSKALTQAMGGQFRIESEPGSGTVVRCIFPWDRVAGADRPHDDGSE